MKKEAHLGPVPQNGPRGLKRHFLTIVTTLFAVWFLATAALTIWEHSFHLRDLSEILAAMFVATCLSFLTVPIFLWFRSKILPAPNIGLSPGSERLLAVLRLRARWLRGFGITVLVLIVITLAAGVSLFVFSGRIVQSDTGSGYYHRSIYETTRGLDDEEETLKNIRNSELSIQRLDFWLAANHRIKQEAVEELKRFNDQLETAPRRDLYLLLSTVSTRVASVVMLVFLVQILVSLYRYNMKLAAFYDSRADALEATQPTGDFATLVNLLSTQHIAFDKEPTAPTEQLATLLKQVAESSGKSMAAVVSSNKS